MKILLDTHILIWLMNEDVHRLGRTVVEVLENPRHTVYVSDISVWEIAIKMQARRNSRSLFTGFTTLAQVLSSIRRSSISRLELFDEHMLQLDKLPESEQVGNHRDPFDRLLIAQAIAENMILISADRKFLPYAEQTPLYLLPID